jgi:hypothetical protein
MDACLRPVKVYGVLFSGLNKIGDFAWMVKKQKYNNTLFVIMENFLDAISDDKSAGGGTAILRPLTKVNDTDTVPPRAVGIPTGWSMESGGFSHVGIESKRAIDLSVERINSIISKFDSIAEIVFSCDSKTPDMVGTNIFRNTIGSDVIAYITAQLMTFSTGNVRATKMSMSSIRKLEIKELLTTAMRVNQIELMERKNARLQEENEALKIILVAAGLSLPKPKSRGIVKGKK